MILTNTVLNWSIPDASANLFQPICFSPYSLQPIWAPVDLPWPGGSSRRPLRIAAAPYTNNQNRIAPDQSERPGFSISNSRGHP
jgi:hypothetical protein